MQARLRHLRKLRGDEYRMTLDLIDAERGPWDQGDCVVQIDLLTPRGSARGLLKPALELYRLMPAEPPTTSEARLLWDIGETVHRYLDRLFEGGLLCPCGPRIRDNAPRPPALFRAKTTNFSETQPR